MPGMDRTYDDTIARLAEISEYLADRALDVLRSAVDAGETARPAEERIITRARAAVDKAIGLLSGLDGDGV